MTNYVVLRKTGNTWEILGKTTAHNPQQARKSIDDGEGEFLVVPVRNATFISGSVEQPPPKPVSVEVAVETYLPQLSLDGEPTQIIEPEVPSASASTD
jgi:hypothetical protein